MNKQQGMLLALGLLVLVALAVVVWSFRQPVSRGTPQQTRQNANALQQQVGAVQSNPNIPPQAKQWLEYNLRQQQAGGAR